MEGLCGAYTGGIIAIGVLLGRDRPGEDLRECATAIRKFTDRFTRQYGSRQCMTVMESFGGKPPMGCVRITAEATLMLTELLGEWEQTHGVSLLDQDTLPRATMGLGQWPFSSQEQAPAADS